MFTYQPCTLEPDANTHTGVSWQDKLALSTLSASGGHPSSQMQRMTAPATRTAAAYQRVIGRLGPFVSNQARTQIRIPDPRLRKSAPGPLRTSEISTTRSNSATRPVAKRMRRRQRARLISPSALTKAAGALRSSLVFVATCPPRQHPLGRRLGEISGKRRLHSFQRFSVNPQIL